MQPSHNQIRTLWKRSQNIVLLAGGAAWAHEVDKNTLVGVQMVVRCLYWRYWRIHWNAGGYYQLFYLCENITKFYFFIFIN